MNESHDASPASERRDGMTIEIRARGTTTKSKVRMLIYANGIEIGCCKKKAPEMDMIYRITLYSNVVDQEDSYSLRCAIFSYLRRNEYSFSMDDKIRYCEKYWTQRIPHVSQPKKEG